MDQLRSNSKIDQKLLTKFFYRGDSTWRQLIFDTIENYPILYLPPVFCFFLCLIKRSLPRNNSEYVTIVFEIRVNYPCCSKGIQLLSVVSLHTYAYECICRF